MPLSDVELRVLGALLEKERTTPESYPLSSQALVSACNQRSNREPVSDYHLQDVLSAVDRLRDRGLAETIQGVADRVPKHRQRASQALDLNARQVAVLAVLLLRGAQTPGELRTRTERYVDSDLAAVDATLRSLADRSVALVQNVGRGPGQSQDRWVHTLGTDEQKMTPRARPARGAAAAEPDESPGSSGRTVERATGTPAAGMAAAGSPAAGMPATGMPAAGMPATGTPGMATPGMSVESLRRRIEALEARVSALETRFND